MIDRIKSLRVWLLLTMLVTAVAAILVGNLVIGRLNANAEHTADRAKGLQTVHAIARRVQQGAGRSELRTLQRTLPNDQIVVVRNGRTVFAGPELAQLPIEVVVSAPFPGGKVILRDHHSPSASGVAQWTLVAAAITALVIAEAWLGATLLMRTVRGPLSKAIETADRVADGDFSARTGVTGPEELARLGRALDKMAAQLQRTDGEQRRFLADLAHEIATPVSAMSGFACALVDGDALTPAERTEAADTVEHESQRLRRLLDDVRNLNRLEYSESTHREQVHLDQLCAETAHRLRLAAQEAQVALRLDTRRVAIIADPRLLEAVVNNFASNAIRYTQPGGEVELRVRRSRSSVVVAVRDTGIGLAAEQLDRIFDRFYRVDEARARATGGSGLGLAIARRAAQSVGGRIEVDSIPGQGSEFRLVIPMARRA
ncbi:MAG TPA: HAMP domain-containing sensor histidine kinase [Nocardioidaceae bacterium]|nr:HAMP domain-containing sensor histidine kinase [Nocardioidaceae bacterium]